MDPFFKFADAEMEDDSSDDEAEKREVARDGQIPKLKKNIEREEKERAEKERIKEKKKLEKEWRVKSQRPIKINPSNYRVAKSGIDSKATEKKHILL